MKDLIKAIDRLAATLIVAAVITKKDMAITHIDQSKLQKVIEDNPYFKDA